MTSFNLLSALGFLSLIAAFWGTKVANRIARHKNTIDVFLVYQYNMEEAYGAFNKESKKKGGLNYSSILKNSKTRIHIHSYLNFYEMLAAAIRGGALKEDLAKIYFHSMIISDYDESKKYIAALRKDKKDLDILIEFENLYKAWKNNKNYQSFPIRAIG